MKVAFDIKNHWLYGKGIGSFTINLLKDLAYTKEEPYTTIQLYSPSFQSPALSFLEGNKRFQKVETGVFNKESKLDKVKYDQVTFLRYLKAEKPDVLFSPYFDIPLFWSGYTITTIHDLSIYEGKGSYSKAFYFYYKTLLKKALRQSTTIVTVSNYSREKIINVLGFPEEDVKIIYNKAPEDFIKFSEDKGNCDSVSIREKYKLPQEFILYTGGLEVRKNIGLLVNGISNVRKNQKQIPPLVITGISIDKIPQEYKYLLKNDDIILIGLLPFNELANLYKLSSLIVNTSSYEGFGIPVLEALTMKKPMLCSGIPVYEEVGGEFAYYFESNNQSDFEEKLSDFFNGNVSSLNQEGMATRANIFNNRNYSELFFQIVNKSIQ